MKVTKKNLSTYISFLIFGLVIGTLGWEVIERILSVIGMKWSFGVGPVGFDVHVISMYLYINPGSFLGVGGAVLLFRSL